MIFVIEDEPVLRRSVVDFLASSGQTVEGFADAESALEAATASPPDVAVCDLQLPRMSGLELMEKLAEIDAGLIRIAMTAHSSVDSAVRAMRGGCYEYLEKPVDLQRLARLVERAMRERRSGVELAWLRREPTRGAEADDGLLGDSAAIHAVREQIDTLAELGADAPPVLITGETGVGKGLVARLIHDRRFGESAPWIELNCAALPATLIEAELFGYERSAFTDAKQAKPGLFEAAAGGTIFLDEIGALPVEMQTKLLKVVESGGVRRLGAVRERPVQVAIVAASNRDPQQALAEGTLRPDLYHRLAAFTIRLPPLREREGDALRLARAFLERAAQRYRKPLTALSPEAEQRIAANPWPGNIRELEFALERAVLIAPSGATALPAHVLPDPATVAPLEAGGSSPAPASAASSNGPAVEADETGHVRVALPEPGIAFADLERAILQAALGRTGGNVARAARLLDLKRDAMRYRIQKLGLSTDGTNDDPTQ